MADHVPFVADANVINELPREFETDNDPIHQQHHDYNKDDDDETPLKRESAADVIPLCVLNKEALLPLIQYKRKRKTESSGNSLKTEAAEEVLPLCLSFNTSASASAKPLRTIVLPQHQPWTHPLLPWPPCCWISPSKEENLLTKENRTESVVTLAPEASSSTKPIKEVHKENHHQIAVEREKLKLDLMSAEMIMNLLQGRMNALREENEELRKNISSSNNQGQCS